MVLFLPVFESVLMYCSFYLKCINTWPPHLSSYYLWESKTYSSRCCECYWQVAPRSYLAFLGVGHRWKEKTYPKPCLFLGQPALNTEHGVVKGLFSQAQLGMAVMGCSSSGYLKWFPEAPSETNQFPVSLPSPSAHSCFFLPFSSLGADSQSILRKISFSGSASEGIQFTTLLISALLKNATFTVLIITPWKIPYKGWLKGPQRFMYFLSILKSVSLKWWWQWW